MVRFALRLPDEVHGTVQQWANRDDSSMNEWIVSAIERETLRRALLAHNEYVKTSPSYTMEAWQAEDDDIADALRQAAR